MSTSSNQEKKWLVKSENRILGPYAFDQLEDLLKKRQISLIDEVRDTDTRWLYIREMPNLKELVDKVRVELEKIGDHTKTLQTGSGTIPSNTMTLTDPSQKTQEITKTETLPSFTDVNMDVQDVPYSEQINPTVKDSGTLFKANKRFISNNDPNVQHEIAKKTNSSVLIVVSLIVGVVLSSIGFYFYRDFAQKRSEEALERQVRKYQMFGLENKAIEIYQKLPVETQKEILPDIIPLIPRLESSGLVNSQEVIETLKANPKLTNDKKSLVELVEFNQFIQIQDYQKAKGSLIKAKDYDPSSEIVKEDEAILAFYENKFEESAQIFKSLYEKKDKGRLLLGRAIGVMYANKNVDNSDLIELIDRYVTTRIDYRKELIFVQIYLSRKANNENAVNQYIAELVRTPVQLSSQFRTPPFIPGGFYGWSKLVPLAERMRPSFTTKQFFLIDSHIKVDIGQASSAQKLYDQLNGMLETPEDKANLQIAIYYSMKKYQEMIALEKSVGAKKLNLASHMSLFLAKKFLGLSDTALLGHLEVIKSERTLLSQWAELSMMNKSDKDRIKSYLQFNSLNTEDFLPYIEAKGYAE